MHKLQRKRLIMCTRYLIICLYFLGNGEFDSAGCDASSASGCTGGCNTGSQFGGCKSLSDSQSLFSWQYNRYKYILYAAVIGVSYIIFLTLSRSYLDALANNHVSLNAIYQPTTSLASHEST